MGSVTGGSAELTPAAAPAPGWDRFARWDALAARLALLALALLLIASALVPLNPPGGGRPPIPVDAQGKPLIDPEEYDQDIALYEAAIRRIEHGEHYYDFIAAEHRAREYPLRPGLSVRLPTLAYIEAGLNRLHLGVPVSILVMLAAILVWWRRFGEEPGVGRLRRVGTALAFLGASLALNRHYYSLHELWAGMLLMIAFGLHRVAEGDRPGRWKGALLCAALALFIREHALPFVLLMGAMAAWRRDWREAAAWGALTLVFLATLAVHLNIVAGLVLPGDREGASWLALRGLSGWIGNVVQAGNLRLLPHWLAGPLVILTTLGWASWRTAAGTFGFLISVGYGLAFMIAGRWDNFYWGAMVAPMLTPGLAFAPRAIASLLRSARHTNPRHPREGGDPSPDLA
jgi:hypothetical protein